MWVSLWERPAQRVALMPLEEEERKKCLSEKKKNQRTRSRDWSRLFYYRQEKEKNKYDGRNIRLSV